MADAPRITVDELMSRMEAGEDFTLIDVRNSGLGGIGHHATRSDPSTAG